MTAALGRVEQEEDGILREAGEPVSGEWVGEDPGRLGRLVSRVCALLQGATGEGAESEATEAAEGERLQRWLNTCLGEADVAGGGRALAELGRQVAQAAGAEGGLTALKAWVASMRAERNGESMWGMDEVMTMMVAMEAGGKGRFGQRC